MNHHTTTESKGRWIARKPRRATCNGCGSRLDPAKGASRHLAEVRGKARRVRAVALLRCRGFACRLA
jgi:hypothetical protein